MLPAWSLPLIVAAICVPVIVGTILQGPGLGLAASAAVGAILLIVAARLRPREGIEVAPAQPGGPRVVVLATGEVGSAAAGRIAERVAGAADVRIVVPLPSKALSRWLSAEDEAREVAQRWLAHSAGALTAAGLTVSGSLGDSDAVQALEDELRDFPADEVIVYGAGAAVGEAAETISNRLDLPVARVSPG